MGLAHYVTEDDEYNGYCITSENTSYRFLGDFVLYASVESLSTFGN